MKAKTNEPLKQNGKMYFTTDNLSFLDEQSAIEHAQQLPDNKITVRTKAEVEAELADSLSDESEPVAFWVEDEEF